MRSALAILVCVAGACGRHPRAEVIEQAVTVAGPSAHDFGSVLKNASSAPFTFTISPASGLQDDTVTEIKACDGFKVDAPGLPAPVFQRCDGGYGGCKADDVAIYQFTVTFQPIVAGFTSCDILVEGTSPQVIKVSGTGTLPDHVASIGPTSMQFGEVRQGVPSSEQKVTIGNAGGMPLTVTSVASTSPVFSIVGGAPAVHQLGVGLTEQIGVRCTPPGVGPFTGNVEVKTNDPLNGTVTIPLACTGVNSDLDISPSSANVATRVGIAADAVLSLTNMGTASATLTSVALRADSDPGLSLTSAPGPGTQLAIGGATTIGVRYVTAEPKAFAATLGTIVVKSANEADRSITISGEALEMAVASQPLQTLDFGPICANVRSALPLAVYASKDGFVTVTGVSASTGLTVTAPSSGRLVALGNRANDLIYDVAVTPAMAGDLTGTITVATDAPLQPQYEVGVQGVVLPDGVSATPARAEFGATQVHGLTAAITVELSNCSGATLDLVGARVEGAVDDFKVTRPGNLMATLQPAEELEIDVIMSPQAPGRRTAQLILEHAGGATTVIDLVGNGIGDDEVVPDRESYYNCSAGGGEAAPVGLALLALVLRRRRRRA